MIPSGHNPSPGDVALAASQAARNTHTVTKDYFPISGSELDRLIVELSSSTTIGNLARELKERRQLAYLTPENIEAALVEYRRWMPGHSGRIGNETFFVCREKDDGEVEWLARHPTAEAMRDDLDRRTVEAVIRAALGGAM